MNVDGKNVVPDVHSVLDKIEDFSARVRSGVFKGCTGKPLRNIVSIGIGRSVTLLRCCWVKHAFGVRVGEGGGKRQVPGLTGSSGRNRCCAQISSPQPLEN